MGDINEKSFVNKKTKDLPAKPNNEDTSQTPKNLEPNIESGFSADLIKDFYNKTAIHTDIKCDNNTFYSNEPMSKKNNKESRGRRTPRIGYNEPTIQKKVTFPVRISDFIEAAAADRNVSFGSHIVELLDGDERAIRAQKAVWPDFKGFS